VRLPDILGHAQAKLTLTQGQARERLHHAYLFAGPEGVGKRRVAYAFIARLLCSSPDPTGEACGQCRHCRRVLETPGWYDDKGPFPAKDDPPQLAPRHPDVLTLVAHGNFIKISQVREALRVVPFQPVEAALRFVVIDDAHLMNDEAANALLKTLEEPPARTRFILVSSMPTNLLVTIRSRCQRIAFGRLADAEIAEILARRGADATLADNAIALAQGSARLAIALLDDPLVQQWDPLAKRLLAASSPPEVHALAAVLAELPQREALFDRIARLLRDALLLRVGGAHRLFHSALREDLEAWALARSTDAILARLDLVEDTRLLTRTFNLQPRLAFERMLLAVCAPAGAEHARPLLERRDIL
jgi:DNA polymerase-3 subunit delta'